MIRYAPTSQLSTTGFETPFARLLSADNRWIIFAGKIPWDKLAAVYYKRMRADFGAPKLSARLLIGAVIVEHLLNIDDREVVEQIRENIEYKKEFSIGKELSVFVDGSSFLSSRITT